jgi:hypothetical protein
MTEMVFSVESAPRLYNGDPRPAEWELRESLETAVEDDWEEMPMSSVEVQEYGCEKNLHVCRSYSQTGIITVLKSVTRIRLVKSEKT